MKKVKKNRTATQEGSGEGRVAQRNRTRRAIVEAAMRLLAEGKTPSMADVAEAAEVSRRTMYMYFPTVEQLLIVATLGSITQNTIDRVVDGFESRDPAIRAEQLSHALNDLTAETMHLGRALIRLTVEGETPAPGVPRRGYRRVQWIEKALEPVREELSAGEFERLVSALSVLMGWEPMIVLHDIRLLDQKQADEVLRFAVRAVVEKALKDARLRRKGRDGQS